MIKVELLPTRDCETATCKALSIGTTLCTLGLLCFDARLFAFSVLWALCIEMQIK